MLEDIFFKKLITYQCGNQELRFRVSQDLFSSFQIDAGTRFLIRAVTPDCTHNYRKILDLGCGYGPIGLTLKALCPESVVHMTDPDALAVAYSRRNTEINHLDGVKVYGSLDYDSVTERDFDLVISNIPGKAGTPVISHIIEDAFHYLSPQGIAAVVVVTPLEPLITELINNNSRIKLLDFQTRPGHAVFRYGFTAPHDEAAHPAPGITERDVYYRGSEDFIAGGFSYRMETAYGLPEFDQLGYATELLIDGLKNLRQKSFRHILVFNPLAGHIPVVIWKMFKPGKISLAGRSLLGLRYSAKNLLLNGFPNANMAITHRAGLDTGGLEKADLITGILRDEEGNEAITSIVIHMGDLLNINGTLLLSAGSTSITRIIRQLSSIPSLVLTDRKKHRGSSILILSKQFN